MERVSRNAPRIPRKLFHCSYLLRKKEVGEDLHPSDWIIVSVELDEWLGLVVGEPDGSDTLEFDEADRKMRDEVASKIENCELRQVTHFIWQPDNSLNVDLSILILPGIGMLL